MLASYVYSAKKIVKLKSTWIVVFIFCALSLGISGILPFQVPAFTDASNYLPKDIQDDAVLLVSYTASAGTILLMSVATFAGFRGSTMYRDEVEDGSLLVMLSKPIGRQRLILGKWLAFMTALVGYAIALSLSHNLGVAIGSGFTVDFKIIGIGFITEVGVGLIFTVMFAALALLFSLFFSATQTALTTTAIGLVAGMTTVVQPLTANPQRVEWAEPRGAERTDSSIVFSSSNALLPESRDQNGVVSGLDPSEGIELIAKMAVLAYGQTPGAASKRQRFDTLVDSLIAKGVMDGRPDFSRFANLATSSSVDRSALIALFKDDINMLNFLSFFNTYLYYDTGNDELYKKLLWLDFGGQVSTLTSFAITSIFGSDYLNSLSSFNYGRFANFRKDRYSAGELDAPFMKGFSSSFYELAKDSQLLNDTPERTYLTVAEKDERVDGLFAEYAQFRGPTANSFAVVRYRDYMDRTALTVSYILIAVALVPLSLLVLRRKDFG